MHAIMNQDITIALNEKSVISQSAKCYTVAYTCMHFAAVPFSVFRVTFSYINFIERS